MSTLSVAQEMLDMYLQAEKTILGGQSVTIAGKSYTMSNLNEVRTGRQEWERTVDKLSGVRKGPRVSRVVPID